MLRLFSAIEALAIVTHKAGWIGDAYFTVLTGADAAKIARRGQGFEIASIGMEDDPSSSDPYGSGAYVRDPYGTQPPYDFDDFDAEPKPIGNNQPNPTPASASLLKDPSLQAGNGMVFGPAQIAPAQDMDTVLVQGVRINRGAGPPLGWTYEMVDDGIWAPVPIIGAPRPPRKHPLKRTARAATPQASDMATVTILGQRPDLGVPDWRVENDAFAPRVYEPGTFDPQLFDRPNPRTRRRGPLVVGLSDPRGRHDPSSADPFGLLSDNVVPTRPENTVTARDETHHAPMESGSNDHSFWDRGGTNLVLGGTITVLTGVALTNFWNPAGWLAGGAAALLLAGGIAGSAAGATQLWYSYGHDATAEQDMAFDRAASTPLLVSSPVGLVAGVTGAVATGDAVGFENWAAWGGLAEGGVNLARAAPTAIRAMPGMWRATVPWLKYAALQPFWFSVGMGGGGGSVKAASYILRGARRAPAGIRSIEYLGTTLLLERQKDWARYQVFITRSRSEGVFRITYTNGQIRIVQTDRFAEAVQRITEAKFGDMGMMFNLEREQHIMSQARAYLDISDYLNLRGGVRYAVSTELGAQRLLQRFSLDFPEAVASRQLTIDWVQWTR
ncbi:hypothetical protein VXE65_32755 [Mycolicibacterium conceptionense]|uniref:hypothetical protein n=1 Tax=Mycolicibacterium conceptionense TaxID=451644 RepID=UPI003204A194